MVPYHEDRYVIAHEMMPDRLIHHRALIDDDKLGIECVFGFPADDLLFLVHNRCVDE